MGCNVGCEIGCEIGCNNECKIGGRIGCMSGSKIGSAVACRIRHEIKACLWRSPPPSYLPSPATLHRIKNRCSMKNRYTCPSPASMPTPDSPEKRLQHIDQQLVVFHLVRFALLNACFFIFALKSDPVRARQAHRALLPHPRIALLP